MAEDAERIERKILYDFEKGKEETQLGRFDWIRGRQFSQKSCLNQKLSLFHDLLVVNPDIELGTDDVYVCGGSPVGAGVFGVRVAERDMHARYFLVLEDMADDMFELDIGTDGKLTDTFAVFIGMAIGPEFLFELLVG